MFDPDEKYGIAAGSVIVLATREFEQSRGRAATIIELLGKVIGASPVGLTTH